MNQMLDVRVDDGQASAWQLRPMNSALIEQVAQLETRAYEFPWSANSFVDCLNAGYAAWVWICDDRVLAYGVMMMGAGEAHLLNLCVDPEWRRVGLARSLLDHLLRIAGAAECERMFLEVRLSNLAAQQLYDTYGFSVVGRRKGYYPAAAGREDAIVMVRELLPLAVVDGGR